MVLEYSAIPLAFLAGGLGIMSPCVWPLIPVVMGVTASGGKYSPYAMALGLSVSFALAGTLLSLFIVSMGLDPELFRYVAAVILVLVALILLIPTLANRITLFLSNLSSRIGIESSGNNLAGPFGVGFLTGIVWLPCVGPTLGAAIALASMGQDLFKAFIVMLAFGLGNAVVLLVAASLSTGVLRKFTSTAGKTARWGKNTLGGLLLILGLLVLTGVDKLLEAWALSWLPDWAFNL